MTAHEGVIFAESEPGEGATFHLLLPRAFQAVSGEAQSPETGAEPAANIGSVLVVEDDETVAAGIEVILSFEQIDVRLVYRGGEAVGAIEEFRPAAVILDVSLPDMQGPEVYRLIAGRWPDLPVVFSTGHGDARHLESLAARENVGFLMKPYSAQQLLDELRLRIQRASEHGHVKLS